MRARARGRGVPKEGMIHLALEITEGFLEEKHLSRAFTRHWRHSQQWIVYAQVRVDGSSHNLGETVMFSVSAVPIFRTEYEIVRIAEERRVLLDFCLITL